MLMVFIWLAAGLIVGSFINAYVWRLHESKDWVAGRSQCPNCNHPLAPLDLVPVLSWLWLGGKCRYCAKPISIQYPLVEAITAGLPVLSYLRMLPVGWFAWLSFGLWLYYLTVLLILAVYDLRWMLLPDVVLLPAIGVASAQLLFNSWHFHALMTGSYPALAALLAGGGFYLIAAVSKGKWMGGGDIKLAFFMGLILGLRQTAVAMFLAFDTAAAVGLVLIALKIKKRTDHIPFGPFLVAGTIAAMLYGQTIIKLYMGITNL